MYKALMNLDELLDILRIPIFQAEKAVMSACS